MIFAAAGKHNPLYDISPPMLSSEQQDGVSKGFRALSKPPLMALRGGAATPLVVPPLRSKGLTRLLFGKSILTVLSGLPVLVAPKKILGDLGFPLITPPHVHMTKMWGVWMCCFQVLLEMTFALHVQGVARNLFVLIEGVFEVALLMEVAVDRRTTNAALYSAPIEGTYALTVLTFFGVLLWAPDPVLDAAAQRRALRFVSIMSALMLGAEAASLKGGGAV